MTAVDLYNRRFVLFSGKGGVGKTTMASSFALSCARRGDRTLLLELDVKDKASALFGATDVDFEIREIEDNLYACNVTPWEAMKEYALMVLKIKLVYKAVFENRVVRSFLRVIPGLNELVMLGKAYYHATETDDDGNPVWDKVIVDAPATGHGIFFLKIPAVITDVISSGLMFEEAQRILDLLRDPGRTGIVLVTLAEDMPVNETLMLSDVVRNQMDLPVACVIANAIYRPLFDDDQCQWIDAARQQLSGFEDAAQQLSDDSEDQVSGFLEAARFRNDRVGVQQKYLQQLRDQGDWPLIEIPHYFFDRMSFAVIDEIAADLDEVLKLAEQDVESTGTS